MVAKWRVKLRTDLASTLFLATAESVHACLDKQDDGSGTVYLRVEGTMNAIHRLASLWEIESKDVTAFWY